MSTQYYRFDQWRTTNGVDVFLVTFEVLKRTPHGVWIRPTICGDKRFVLDGARKQYACSTIEEAWTSFNARKARQIKILRTQLREAETAQAQGLDLLRRLQTQEGQTDGPV